MHPYEGCQPIKPAEAVLVKRRHVKSLQCLHSVALAGADSRCWATVASLHGNPLFVGGTGQAGLFLPLSENFGRKKTRHEKFTSVFSKARPLNKGVSEYRSAAALVNAFAWVLFAACVHTAFLADTLAATVFRDGVAFWRHWGWSALAICFGNDFVAHDNSCWLANKPLIVIEAEALGASECIVCTGECHEMWHTDPF